MGTTNFLQSAENKLADLKGELIEKRKELAEVESGIEQMPVLAAAILDLERRIEAGIAFVRPDYPDWDPDEITPRIKGRWDSPFENGQMGLIALTVLRENGGWLGSRQIAKIMLEQVWHEATDYTLRKVSNSVSNYLVNQVGEVVESQGSRPAKYRIIPDF